jgi:D-alanine-D-alanine ligase-like ATP-grasp enzyme
VAGIDLRRTPSGEWYCFEVNPSPAYSWFDLDGRIATAIARFLAG